MHAKIVYNVDPVTRIYTGPQQCYKTSLDPDTWHWTGLAMEVEPLPAGENEINLANAEMTAWVVQPFYVGVKYWLPDGSEHEITAIGEVLPPDALTEKPDITPAQITIFTSLEFIERFTDEEQLNVVEATLSNTAIKLWYDKSLAAGYIDLNDPRVTAGLNALVVAGLITAARKDEILTTE